MTEKRLRELTAGPLQRSPQSAGLQPHEPPNRQPYERPQTECHAAEPCQFLAESSTEFSGTHEDATTNFFTGTHLGSTTGLFGGTHTGSTTGLFGGAHTGSTTGEYGGTHLDIVISGVWE